MKLDFWIEQNIFGLFVRWFCRVTRQSPFAVSRFFWFVTALDGFYRASNIMTAILFGGMSIYMMLAASLRADRPTKSLMRFRALAAALLLFFMARGILTGEWTGTEFWIFVLIALYAADVGTDRNRSGTVAGFSSEGR